MTDTNTVTTPSGCLLLIDSRVADYQDIINAMQPGVQHLVFNVEDTSSASNPFEYIQTRIAELGVSAYTSVGLVQHNMRMPTYSMFGQGAYDTTTQAPAAPDAIIAGVETSDPTLQTWSGVSGFISGLKTTYGIQNFDMMACALYSDPNWKYIIDALTAQTGVTFRASTDDTGAAGLGGDWFLESHTGVNLKDVYFTEAIENYRGVLYVGSDNWDIFGSRRRPIKSFAVGGLEVWGSSGDGGSNNTGVSLTNIVGVTSHHQNFLAIKADGSVVMWGSNTEGGGALYTTTATYISVPVGSLSSGVVDVITNGVSYAALKNDGSVVLWGRRNYPYGATNNTSVDLTSVVDIYATYSTHAFAAIRSNGACVCWGDSILTNQNFPTNNNASSTLTSGVVLVYSNGGSFAALKIDGRVLTWGATSATIGANFGGDSSSVSSDLSSGVVAVYSQSLSHTALKNNGTIVTWGRWYNTYPISTANSTGVVVHIFPSANGLVALKTDGSVQAWGSSGAGSYSTTAPAITNVVTICSNVSSFAALKADGSVVAWGDSNYGGSTTTPVNSASSLTGVIALYSNAYSYAALKSDGSVVCWGNSSYGGSTSSPLNASSSLTGVVRISVTNMSYSALKTNGSVIQWGGEYTNTTLGTANITSGIVDIFNNRYAQAALKPTSTPSYDLSMSYYSDTDRLSILCSRDYRRTANLVTVNSNRFTLSVARSLQKFNYTMPTAKPLTMIVPDYQTPPYSLTSTITLPTSIVGSNSMIITSEIGERVDISGVGTYVNYGTYVYKVESNGTYTKTTSLTINSISYNLYGGDGVYYSGIALYNPISITPTLTNFSISPKTYGIDTSFNLVDPSSNSPSVFTFTSSNTQVATISGRTVTIIGTGTSVITASQGGSGNFINADISSSFVVNQLTTVLGTFTVPAKIYGDASFNLVDPSSNSPVAFTFTSGNTQVATISGRTITIVGAGTSVITASQAGGNYSAANATASLVVSFGNLSSLNSKFINDGPFVMPTPLSSVLTTYGSTWNQLGSDIIGKVAGDESGTSLSVSADGTIVAIGSRSNTGNRGTVRVYKYNDISWNQLGSDINGEASSDYSGQSVSLSANGQVIAIGANMNDGSGNLLPDSGQVRIYEFNGTSWGQRGGDIDGEANADQSGYSVSLSADGNTVAIGAIMNDGSGNLLSNSGHVRVYKYNASKTSPQLTNQNLSTFGPVGWDRLGADIDGEAVNDQSGFSVGISADGTIVAIGAIFNDGTSGTVDTSNNRGHVRVYKYNSSKTDPQLTNQGLTTYGPAGWDRMGSDIDGEVAADQSGFSVSLSTDGTTVAIGSPLYDVSGVSNSGRVRVFAWNGTAWGQRGGNINGVSLNENVGDSVSLSADGTILSVSSFMKVINYNYNSSTNTWSQIGANVTGVSSTSNIMNALAYSPHVYLDATNPSSYNGTTWTNIGSLGGNVVMTNMGTFDAIDNGGSFNFNGSSNFGRLDISSSTLTSLTYVAVVKTNLINSGQTIIDFGNDNLLLYVNGSGNLIFYTPTTTLGFSLTTGVWYVFALTLTTGGAIRFYVNGVSVFSGNVATINTTNTFWGIGSGMPGPNELWNGKISALAIYHNKVLTATEIANINATFQTYKVSLSSQGNIVAIGAREYDGVTGTSANIGTTRVYKIDSSGNYTYTSNNSAIADICGNIVLPKSGGSTTITVTQSASGANTSKTGTAQLTLSYRPTFQTYTIASKTFGDASFNLTDPSSDGPGSFTFTSSNTSVATISGRTVTIVGTGTTTITATQAASGDYISESVTASFVVNKITTVLGTFTVPTKIYGDASFNLVDPSSNSPAAFTFTSSNTQVATISGRTVTIIWSGTSVITASQAAGNYTSADISASLVVSSPILSNFVVPAKIYGDASFNLDDPSSTVSYGTFTFTSGNTQVATISGRTVTIIGPGTSIITASQGGTDISASLLVNFGNLSSISSKLISDGPFVIPTPISNVATTYGTTWNQLGAVIYGEIVSSLSGTSVSISADGTVVAIGAYRNDGSGNLFPMSGHVRVYKYTPNKTVDVTNQNDLSFGPIGWTRLGADIDGEAAYDRSGYTVSLSADGTVVAIGAPYNDGTGPEAGHARVYKYNASKTVAQTNQAIANFGPIGWDRLGADIDGESSYDYSGYSVTLSADGTVVAIGAYNNKSNGGSTGHVRIYKYNASKTVEDTNQAVATYGPVGWDRLGADIDGEGIDDDQCGYSVSLSANGTVVAIGTPYNNGNGSDAGHVRVYRYNASKTVAQTNQDVEGFGPIGWERLGKDIDGEALGNNSGKSVCISADGTTVAIGAPLSSKPSGLTTGHVRVYKYNASKTVAETNQAVATFGPVGWDRLGADIDGEDQSDQSGYSVSLSSDGTIVAIGAPYNNAISNRSDAGHVRVYKYNALKTVEQLNDDSVLTFGPVGWNRLGVPDIDGLSVGDNNGCSVSLSADGTVIAIGAIAQPSSTGGYVRVYKIDSSGNYTYTSGNSAVAEIYGNIVLPKTGGSTTLTITQSASGANTSKNVTVPTTLKTTPTFQTYTITSKNFGDASFNLTDPSSNSPGTFTFTSSNASVATVSGRTVTIVGAGTTSITATQAASGYYISGSVTASFTVNPITTVLGTFTVPIKTYGDASFNLVDPSSNSPAAITFTSGNTQVATISGRTITIVGPGASVITASQDASANYSAATTTTTFDVSFGNLTSLSSKVINDGPFVLPTPLSNVATTYGSTWNILSPYDIDGESPGDYSGYSVSMSADGTIVAIGALQNDGPNANDIDNRGHVRVYKYNANKLYAQTNPSLPGFGPVRWDRLGEDIDGEENDDRSGTSVSISADGTIVAIGAPGIAQVGAGQVRVYKYNANKTVAQTNQSLIGFGPAGWDRLGADIDGYAEGDNIGGSVTLSADGTIVAVGSTQRGTLPGYVSVYKYRGVKTQPQLTNQSATDFGPAGWDRLGTAIIGEAGNSSSGSSVSISANGTVVAIGAPYNINANGRTGHVRVYVWNNTEWVQRGADIDGEAESDRSGVSVSISADGTTVAIGAPLNNGSFSGAGHTRVYKYNALKTVEQPNQSLTGFGPVGWDRLGADIDGEGATNGSGSCVSLSADGTVVAIGATGNVVDARMVGHVRVYKYTPSKNVAVTNQTDLSFGPIGWTRIGTDIDGEWTNIDNRINSVSLSSDGTIVAIGAYLNDGPSSNSSDNRGHVRIYKIDSYGNYTYTSNNSAIADICGNIVLPKSGGSTTITVTQSASGANTSKSATVPLTFSQITPTIGSLTVPAKNFGDASFNLTAPISDSNGAFTYTSSNTAVATVTSGGTVTVVGAGSTTITATQAATTNYTTGSVTASLVVSAIAPTIETLTAPAKNFGDASFNLTAPTSNSGGAFSYTSSNTAVATVTSSGTVTVVGAGSTTITATQAATTNYTSGTVTASLVVSAIAPTYQSISQITKTYSTDVSFSLTSIVTGISDSSGVYSFSSESNAIDICGGVATILAYTPLAITIMATQAASGNYSASSTTFSLLVNRKTPSYGPFSIPAKTYGDASFSVVQYAPTTDSLSVPFTYTSSEPNVATINSNGTVVTIIGQGYSTITASQEASGNYAANSITTSFLVNRAAPTFLKAFTIPNKTFGDASFSLLPFTEGLDNTDGTYHFTSSNAQLVSISDTDNVTAFIHAYTPDPIIIYVAIDACGNYAASSTSGTLNVSRATPTIGTLTAPAKNFRDASFNLTAPTSDSSGAFSYTSSNTGVATVTPDGGVVTIVGAGSTTITATQASATNYTTGSVTASLVVSPIAPTIGALSAPAKNFRDASFNLTAPTTDSSGAFSYTSSNTDVATVTSDGGVVTIVGAGSTTITATQDSTTNFTGGSVNASLVVSPIAPTIGALSAPAKNFRDASFNLTAPTSDSSGAFSYTSSNTGVATITSGGVVTVIGTGSTTITATQALTTNYTTGSVTASLVVSPIAPTIGALTVPAKNFGDASFNLSAPTTDSSGAFSYTSSDPTVATVTSSGGTVIMLKVGNTTITATQDACGNFISGSVSASLVVSASLSNFTVPAKNYADAAFDLTDPTSTDTTVGFTFASSNTAVATIGGTGGRTVSIVGVGSTVITATQAATANRGELNISATLVVTPITPVITLAPITKAYGNSSFRLAPSSTNTDTSGGSVFSFSSNNISVASLIDPSMVRINGVGTATIAITQASSANFTGASGSVVITVNKGASGFSSAAFSVAANKTYGDASFSITTAPTSYSIGAITYSTSDVAVATIDNNGVITVIGFGVVNFTATQAETALYAADTKVSNNLSVARKTVALTRAAPSGSTITKYYGDADFSVSATNESNGAFSFSSSDISFATVNASSGLVRIVAVGTTTITASRAQTAQYTSTPVSWTLQIDRGTTTLSGLSSITRNVTVAPFTVTASSASNGAVTYALQDPTSTVLTIHPTSGLVTLLSPGSAVIVASQAQGTLYEAPSSITATITVTAAANTLQGATLTSSTSFANVNLNGASLANTNITNTNFSSASLENTNFNSSDISGANMTSAGLSSASLTNTNITNTNFSSARLGNANFNNSTIIGSNMTSADLSGATMTGATITGTNFTSAILQRVDLSGSSARRCIFNNADLSGCNLRRIDASGSSFVNSNLRGANLSNANFTNSDQTSANINGANISNVSYTVPQKLQLLRNLENRAISELQVSQTTGSNILSVVSNDSSLKDVPNITNATFKVTTPITTNVSGMNIIDIVLDVNNNTYFYFPINDTEYFRIKGVIYRIDTTTSPPTVRNYETNAVVENSTYDTKAIKLIAGSLTIIVNSQNTLPESSFVVPSTKINTDPSFGLITAPTSNSSAPIVYSSSDTNIATINPSTGVITLTGVSGFVSFTASQVVTETHQSASITSNIMLVNRLIDLTLPGLNQTFSLSTLATLDASSIAVETTDATAAFYVRLSDMTELFKYQTDAADIATTGSSDVKYYVFHRKWPTELKINPSHAMMDKTESAGTLGMGEGFTSDKSLVKHDFVRYIALRLFNTIHGVDLFSNETDLQENMTYLGETVRNNIDLILSGISTTSSSENMSYDASGNKYLTNDASGNTNLCRELMRQIAANEPSRLYNNGANDAGLKSVPLRENDSILFKLTIASAASQNVLTGVSTIPARTYTIKLVLKNTVTNVTNVNTAVTDSDMYPNSYAYSTSVMTYAPTSESSGVYNSYLPPSPIPFSRFGYNGWYYKNTTTAAGDRVKWIVPANSGISTVGELRYIHINLKVYNKLSLPYLVVYTQSGSYRKYTIASPNSLVNGTVYAFYMNFNTYSREPAIIGSTNTVLTYSGVNSGSFANNEVITSIAVETESGTAAGSVEFTLASVVVGEVVSATSVATQKEYGFSAAVPMAYP